MANKGEERKEIYTNRATARGGIRRVLPVEWRLSRGGAGEGRNEEGRSRAMAGTNGDGEERAFTYYFKKKLM